MSNLIIKNAGATTLRLLLGLHVALIAAVGCSAGGSSGNAPVGGTTASGGATHANGGSSATSNTGGSSVTNPSGTGGSTSNGVGGFSNSASGGSSNTSAGGTAGSGIPNSNGGSPSSASGGSASGGSPTTTTGGTSGNGTAQPGYWTSKTWQGCSWTGKGVNGITTVMPQDFVAKAPSAPYCISGTVGADALSQSVALLGFNVDEVNPTTCAYKPVDTTASGPPAVVPTAAGVAVNFVKQGTDTSFILRVQIQGPNGAKDGTVGAADRWCATISAVQGKIFVPWSSFTPSCWMPVGMQGTPYAMQPISAVVFTVPGKPTATPYNFCVNGLAYGTTAADAPDGSAVAGDQTGMIGGPGGTAPDYALDFARAKVNVGGQNYIIQNNNWGNPAGTDLGLTYKNNSFVVTSGSGTGQSAPASFPSIYIGNNGNTANGVFSTSATDHLPIQISQIQSVTSTFRYSGTTNTFNATYDIWFAKTKPTVAYNDGLDGFVMVWLHDPVGKQPIGTQMGTATVAGQSWNVWVGPRGPGPNGSSSNATVVSFVNPVENDNSRSQSFTNVNLKDFMTAAAPYGIAPTLLLTDVFAGFEIWDGGSGGNLSVNEFTAVVK